MKEKKICVKPAPDMGLAFSLDTDTLGISVQAGGAVWDTRADFCPSIITDEGALPFTRWKQIRHERVKTGFGEGIRTSFRCLDGDEASYAFDILCWAEETGKDEDERGVRLHCEWFPIRETGLSIREVRWPGPMEFSNPSRDWYTLVNQGQGVLIPNDWAVPVNSLSFQGRFLTAGGYMPWFGQVKERQGYIAIAGTPWNAGAYVEHPAGGPHTSIGIWWEPSLGKMDDRRCVTYTFLEDCDYNDLCAVYRDYARQTGLLVTLREKAARVPSVEKLTGCAFVHCGIKTKVNPLSDFYDKDQPDKNDHVTPFEKRERLIRDFSRLGVEKLYLHLDGWAEPGYDNKHPDYLPACTEAGGWEGMKKLADTVHECGYLFGIHDQYRDFYLDAESFDPEEAVRLPDGSMPQHSRWAGGPQSYLCASRAPYYVKRNFHEIAANGIHLDGAYLDVFTCNEGDECANPAHRMSRRECYGYRKQCFDWLLSRNILPSSEEVSDWSMQSLVFCHYAPYHFMLQKPGADREGIPVPLFNLVYHDCVVEPWMMDILSYTDGAGKEHREDLMLYALLNGGAPYLVRDGAYENTDGSFAGCDGLTPEETAARCLTVQRLHEKVAFSRLLRHDLLDPEGKRQTSLFSDGTKVTVDLEKGTYTIE